MCGKELEYNQSTHCSEKCLFDSIKRSESFVEREAKRKSGNLDHMATAHILINCDMGFEKPTIDQLKQTEGVTEVYGVFGSYDIIAKLECPSRERLREIVSWKIRKIEHVRTTLTLLDIELK